VDEPLTVQDAATHLLVRTFLVAPTGALLAEASQDVAAATWSVRRRADGVEDTVTFVHRPRVAEVRYRMDCPRAAGVRLVDDLVEVLDAGGTPRVRMGRPVMIDAHGGSHRAKVRIDGCAYDASPLPPWGRSVVPPASSWCEVSVELPDVEYPAVLDPSWTTTATMTQKRWAHAAARLPSGRVLVMGGSPERPVESPIAAEPAVATSELFDPATGTWAVAAPMHWPRAWHTATVLSDGRVLVVGGVAQSASFEETPRAEIFDPATSEWTPTAEGTTQARAGHTATLLDDGRVLIVGGMNDDGYALTSGAASLFDPTVETWTATDPMDVPRYFHAATKNSIGRVVVSGGCATMGCSPPLRDAEVFDPVSGQWIPAAPLSVARAMHASITFEDGKVIAVGGWSDGAETATTELFDSLTYSWTTGAGLIQARFGASPVMLDSGHALIIGGSYGTEPPFAPSRRVEGVSRQDLLWRPVVDLIEPRAGATSTLLANGEVLVAGGVTTGAGDNPTRVSDTAEILRLAPNGSACDFSVECASGYCADRVCCDMPCDGVCEACTAAAKGSGVDGSCGPVAAGFDPRDDCDVDPTSVCGATGACDGLRACEVTAAGVPCGGTTCKDGQQTSRMCDGAGQCVEATTACAPYVCSDQVCSSSCDTSDDCTAGYACHKGQCVSATGDIGSQGGQVASAAPTRPVVPQNMSSAPAGDDPKCNCGVPRANSRFTAAWLAFACAVLGLRHAGSRRRRRPAQPGPASSLILLVALAVGTSSCKGCEEDLQQAVAAAEQGDPASGTLTFVDGHGTVIGQWAGPIRDVWEVGDESGLSTVSFGANVLRVQAGKLGVEPPPGWEVVAFATDMPTQQELLFQRWLAHVQDIDNSDEAAIVAPPSVDLLSPGGLYGSSYSMLYAPLAPFPAEYPIPRFVESSSVPGVSPHPRGWRLSRVYDHGTCSAVVPWDDIFSQIASSMAFESICGAEDATVDLGLFDFPVGWLADNAELHYLEIEPSFDMATGVSYDQDGFMFLGAMTIRIHAWDDRHVAFAGRYRLAPTPDGRLMGWHNGFWQKSDDSKVGSTFHNALAGLGGRVAEAINSSDRLKTRLPWIRMNVTNAPDVCGGERYCLETPTPCKPDDPGNGVQSCYDSVQTLVKVGTKMKLCTRDHPGDPDCENITSQLFAKYEEEAGSYAGGFRQSDFTCDTDASSTTGYSCTFHFPVERINVYPDELELVFREGGPPGSGVHGPMEAFELLSPEDTNGLCNPQRSRKDGGAELSNSSSFEFSRHHAHKSYHIVAEDCPQ
jgi:hypothetical protein